jgi:hypothetical protein
MNTYVKCGIAALAGAAIGAVTAWKIYDHRINQILQECTDEDNASTEDADTNKTCFDMVQAETDEEDAEVDNPVTEKPATFDDYVNIVSTKYHSTGLEEEYHHIKSEEKGDEPETENSKEGEPHFPELISPDEFCEDDSYRTVYWTLYTDDIMADDYGNKIENFKNILGEDVLSSFGTYDPKAVHAKDTVIKCYYEIIKEDITYSSVYGRL